MNKIAHQTVPKYESELRTHEHKNHLNRSYDLEVIEV
jgi:hypothetical protein